MLVSTSWFFQVAHYTMESLGTTTLCVFAHLDLVCDIRDRSPGPLGRLLSQTGLP